ncbi:MAG: hypothetical protein QOH62_2351 [Solirubrobacteraceae bacterium]|jgi:hypothetical protein|nr:hypothetical protein [Solirubrobacteraceae bacterium]
MAPAHSPSRCGSQWPGPPAHLLLGSAGRGDQVCENYPHVMNDLPRLQEELKKLLASWEYAFAMGHGCSIGDHPQHRAVRERALDLRARIAEFTE